MCGTRLRLQLTSGRTTLPEWDGLVEGWVSSLVVAPLFLLRIRMSTSRCGTGLLPSGIAHCFENGATGHVLELNVVGSEKAGQATSMFLRALGVLAVSLLSNERFS